MILEAVLMVTDALEHSTEGVNAQIPKIPVESGDSSPPKVKRILNPLSNDELARGQAPADFPTIVITQWGPSEEAGEVTTTANIREADRIPIAIGLIERATADTAKARRRALYVVRAIKRSLRLLMDNARADDRERNQVQLIQLTEMFADEVDEENPLADFGVLTGFVRVTAVMRDIAA